jgi:hypothetical protein
METRFFIDPESGLAHCCEEHGITEREVLDVLRRPADVFERSDGSMVAEGQTVAGRHLRVIYREFPDRGYTFVITAYDLKGNAKRAYRRRHRRP